MFSLNLTSLTASQKASAAVNSAKLALQTWPNDAAIKIMATRLIDTAENVTKAYAEWTSRNETNEVLAADEKRDNAIRAIAHSLKAISFNPDETLSNMAKKVYGHLFPFTLEFIRAPLGEETTWIKNILAKTNEITSEIQNLGITGHIDNLRKFQDAFDKVYELRSDLLKTKPERVKDVATNLDVQIRSMIGYIEATFDAKARDSVLDPLIRVVNAKRSKTPQDPQP